MNDIDFLNNLAEVLQVESSELIPEFELNETTFDSLALISTIALIDEYYGITINVDKLSSSPNLAALLDLIQKESSK